MMSKTVSTLAFAAASLLALATAAQAQYYPQPAIEAPPQMVTNGPQASRGDFGDWSARRNVIESAHYDRLLETNMAFRHARMRKECGPISDPQLREQCLASFQQYEPTMVGSSMPPRRWRHYRRSAGY